MLKMQDDPDELLKTKGKLKPKKLDPDECMKMKELRRYWVLADRLLKRKIVSARPLREENSQLSNCGQRQTESCHLAIWKMAR
jgi:hypothetical protein